jgi:hypothetical protein
MSMDSVRTVVAADFAGQAFEFSSFNGVGNFVVSGNLSGVILFIV